MLRRRPMALLHAADPLRGTSLWAVASAPIAGCAKRREPGLWQRRPDTEIGLGTGRAALSSPGNSNPQFGESVSRSQPAAGLRPLAVLLSGAVFAACATGPGPTPTLSAPTSGPPSATPGSTEAAVQLLLRVTSEGGFIAPSASLASVAPGVPSAVSSTVTARCVTITAMFGYDFRVTSMRGMIVEVVNFAAELASEFEHKYVEHGSRVSDFRR